MKQLQRLTANAAAQLHAVRAAIVAWLARAQRAATLAAVGMAAAVMLMNPGGAVAYPKEYTLSTPIPDVLDTPRHMLRDQWSNPLFRSHYDQANPITLTCTQTTAAAAAAAVALIE
eukprot:12488-Heterococcus_DN1.PRE.2